MARASGVMTMDYCFELSFKSFHNVDRLNRFMSFSVYRFYSKETFPGQ